MLASQTFDSILQHIQTSNLNFQVQISPFSAVISLKKSLVKDKSGIFLLPPTSQSCLPSTALSDIANLTSKNIQLEKDLKNSQRNYQDAVEDCEDVHKRLKVLQNQYEAEENKIEVKDATQKELFENRKTLEALKSEIEHLAKENYGYRSEIGSQHLKIQDLERSNIKLKQVSDQIHKELNNTRTKFKRDKTAILRAHRAEVKSWRLELGEETKIKNQLEEKLSDTIEKLSDSSAVVPENGSTKSDAHLAVDQPLMNQLKPVPLPQTPNSNEILCSLCASPIPNYIPKYFHGEPFSPACDKCDDKAWLSEESSSDEISLQAVPIPFTRKGFDTRSTFSRSNTSSSSSSCSHTPQCIIRQPFPPPLPALTPLVNEYSLYHEKTMAGELGWGSTCWYCMRIEYEKYGCDSCVWIKCFGELHGYPDIAPHDYKDYL